MSSDHPATESDHLPTEAGAQESQLVWGAPVAARRWGPLQTVTAVTVAAVIATLGGAAVYAATNGGPDAARTPPGRSTWHGGRGPGGPPPGANGVPNPATAPSEQWRPPSAFHPPPVS